jgi:phage major head subunit gpT-like protein
MLESAQMRGASESFKLIWIRTLQYMTTLPPQIAAAMMAVMRIPEADFKGLYRWFEGLPIMRHWIGDRKASQLRAEGFEVIHKHFESTIRVFGGDIKFDKLGGYRPAIQRMAQELMLLPYRRMLLLMLDGFAGADYLCFDGLPLFSDTHATGDNKSDIVLADGSDIDEAKAAMRAFVDPTNGDSLFIEPTHIWFHVDLQATVEDIIDTNPLASGAGNKHYKSLEKVPLYLGSGQEAWWGLFSLPQGDPLRPILWQFDPSGGNFTAMDNPTDQAAFMRDEFFYGTDAWGAAACGFPWYAWGSDGSA